MVPVGVSIRLVLGRSTVVHLDSFPVASRHVGDIDHLSAGKPGGIPTAVWRTWPNQQATSTGFIVQTPGQADRNQVQYSLSDARLKLKLKLMHTTHGLDTQKIKKQPEMTHCPEMH